MKNIYKILTTTGIVSAFGVGVAGIVVGQSLAADKLENASITDYGSVSLLTKHLFDVEKSEYKTLDQVAENNTTGKKGIDILNIGDSVAHGDYTWQILDDVNDKENEHYLEDGPPRIGSYYGFLVDALRKAGKLPKDYSINYDTSVSGLRMFELLNWFKTHEYQPLKDEVDSNNVRAIDTEGEHKHSQVNEERNNLIKKLETTDIVTMSIGGNDLIRAVKLFGKPFHDSFDTSTWGDKLQHALDTGNIGEVISIDMDGLADILTEMEENLESTLQLIHLMNPKAKVMLFETVFPFIHFPKVIRNAMAPLYAKVKEMAKRVININVTKNDGKSPDVHGVVHPVYEQSEIDTDSMGHSAGEIIQDSQEEQEGSGLNWASYTSIDFTGSKNGDPNDIYKANSIDIHPTIEGQGWIALKMIETMKEKFGFTFPTGVDYDQSDVDKRIKFVRELHNGEKQFADDDAYNKKVDELNIKYYPGMQNIESPIVEKDSVYDVPVDEEENGNVTPGIEVEKRDNKFYAITRALFGAIDAFTDRVYLRDDLALKELDFKDSSFENYDDYNFKVKDLKHAASFAYDKYSKSLDMSKPENKKYAGTGGLATKIWESEATNWIINLSDKDASDPERMGVSKLFDFDEYKFAIRAYKEGSKLMLEQSSKWDMDQDKRFTLSDIQLSNVSSLDFGGSITGLGGMLDQLTSWTDFNNLWTRVFTDSFTGAPLTRPDYSDKSVLGRIELTPEEIYQTHLVSGSGNYDIIHGIGLDPSTIVDGKEVKLGQLNSTINRLKALLHHVTTNDEIQTIISDFIKDHKDDLSGWLKSAIDFIKDIDIAANRNVVFDFMSNLMGDFGTVDELVLLVQKLLEDKNIKEAIGLVLKDNGIELDLENISSTISMAQSVLINPVVERLEKMSNEDRKVKFGQPFAELVQKLMDQIFSSSTVEKPIMDTLKEFVVELFEEILPRKDGLNFHAGIIKTTIYDMLGITSDNS